MVGLGDLPGGSFFSVASAVSADGTTIVGGSDSADGTEAFRWTSTGGMIGLGDLPGGAFHSHGYGVSGDGSVIVGEGTTAAGRKAFIWTQAGGMADLQTTLIDDYGLAGALAGWTLESARAVSPDGRTIVGFGINPWGQTEAWLAVIPEPSTYAVTLAALSLLAVLTARHRRRARPADAPTGKSS
ncbi:MAG: PEP-CTERM sorting domain-containing protein [Verrucomicrobia bacterium]|nr:MAG: PEP-CTERM sorting domain-containing protein [Verrucomicrobiota bacterium]